MKKKTSNKSVQLALVAALVVIWGMVAFQFNSYQQDAPAVVQDQYLPLHARSIHQQERFTLSLNYKDPFLKKSYTSKSTASTLTHQPKSVTPIHPKIKAKNKSVTKLPKIKYSGYSQNEKNIKRVILSVNGDKKSLKLNDHYKELKVVNIERDSVVVRVGSEHVVVYRDR